MRVCAPEPGRARPERSRGVTRSWSSNYAPFLLHAQKKRAPPPRPLGIPASLLAVSCPANHTFSTKKTSTFPVRTFPLCRWAGARTLNQPPIISFNPSTIKLRFASVAFEIFFPILLTESVRIWLILTQDFLGSFALSSSKVRGNPAFGAWLVNATAMTVPECSLKTD